METLYHFTCEDHGLPGIMAAGRIFPQPQPWFLGGHIALVWLTDVADPVADPHAIGLGKAMKESCNRLAARFTVYTRYALPWRDWVALHQGELEPGAVTEVERFRQPEHWWVSPMPIRRYTIDRPPYG